MWMLIAPTPLEVSCGFNTKLGHTDTVVACDTGENSSATVRGQLLIFILC